MKDAKAANWVVESFENEPDGFKLLGTSKGYTSFSRAFNHGDKVFYAAHDDDGSREAGWAVYSGGNLTDRHPTATLQNNVYTEGTPAPIAFKGQCTIACTFNQLPFEMLWEHIFDEENPHNVKAPQVDLEPVLAPLGPDEQNVQDALEFLYSYFSDSGGGDWHLTHIDGNHVYIEIKHGPDSEFPPAPTDLKLAELKINHDEGHLWTKLADGTVVKIGDKDFITEAPLDGDLYGRKDGDWHRVSLATVSDSMPQNPTEGDLWVDTKDTMELYVFIGGSGWVSMTGAGTGGGGTLPDNVVLDESDGTMIGKLLGREIDEAGNGRWRPIYSDDVIPADGAGAMTRADGSVLRNQADINKFLYASALDGGKAVAVSDTPPANPVDGDLWFNDDPAVFEMFMWHDGEQEWVPVKPDGQGDWVPVSGGAFTGPIFGPSTPPICPPSMPVWSDFPFDPLQTDILDDLSTFESAVVFQVRMPNFNQLPGGMQNKFKIRPQDSGADYSGWADGNDATIFFSEIRGDGRLILQTHTVKGGLQYHRHPDGYDVLYGESETCTGGIIAGGWPTTIYKLSKGASPYVTYGMLQDVGDKYVDKTGDVMTGPLVVNDEVKADVLKSTKLDSGANSNLTIQRNGSTKLLVASSENVAYQPLRYNSDYNLNNDRHLITKGYVDDLVGETVTDADGAYVHKKKDGGDSMEGPFTISGQQGVDSREARRLLALNVMSGSESSSLQLGTKATKIYVGENDTSFNTPLKLNEIQDRGNGINLTGTLKFADQDVLMDIAPVAGTTQTISLFDGIGNSDDFTTLKIDINGATFKKAIEFESGPSSGKETVLRLDSNKGVRIRTLNMDNTPIAKLADPSDAQHAVNLRTVDGLIENLEDRITDRLDTLITDNSSGEMKFVVMQFPQAQGQFMCLTTNGSSTTYDPMLTREIWAHNQNLAGYDFKWDKVEPNTYFYMAGPNESLARFRVVAAPQDQGTWTKIKVNDPEIYPSDRDWVVNEQWDILFRTFTGDSVDLDDYVKKTGDTMTGQLTAQLVTDYIKFEGGSKRIVEDGSYRVEFDKRVIIGKGTTVPGAGFELQGRTSEGASAKLLQAYHNNTGGTDAVNYYGKQDANTNLATVGYVKSIVGGDSDVSGDTPFTPYGPLKTIPSGRVPAKGEISFGSATPAETSSIALSKTDTNNKVWDYQFNADSIFTVSVTDEIGGDNFRQTVSVRVDGVEDKGNWVVLTVDCRDLSAKTRDTATGAYYFVSNPLLWSLNDGAEATPLQKVPATFDELFQFRDEVSIFPSVLRYRLSTSSGDGFNGAGQGRLYMEGSLTSPSNIRLSTLDSYGYGYLGRVSKTTSSSIVSVPGEMTMFARSLWSKQIVPVEGYYFDSLYFNHSKNSMRLQNWGKSWDDGEHHAWKADEEVFVQIDYSPKSHTSARMEQQIAELTSRLAKLEGAK